jgi:hypothetical protein
MDGAGEYVVGLVLAAAARLIKRIFDRRTECGMTPLGAAFEQLEWKRGPKAEGDESG